MKILAILMALAFQTSAFAGDVDGFKEACSQLKRGSTQGTFESFVDDNQNYVGKCAVQTTKLDWSNGYATLDSYQIFPVEQIEALKKACPGATMVGASVPRYFVTGSGGYANVGLAVLCYKK